MSDNINYYQSIPFLGIKGRMNTQDEFNRIGLPKDLIDWSVLDIGCNIGAYLFECHERKAKFLSGIEIEDDWRWLCKGILSETLFDYEFCIVKDFKELSLEMKNHPYDLVLLLSVLHVCGENPQILLNRAWRFTKKLMIVEINDRLQKEKIELPVECKLYGKNKDNRSVYHCVKNNE